MTIFCAVSAGKTALPFLIFAVQSATTRNINLYRPHRIPLVISSAGGHPKDINLYQTSKTLSNALAAVTPGGTMFLLSQCREGFGDADCEAQICNYNSMEAREKALRADFSIGGFVGFLFAETAENYHLILVTDIPAEQFAHTKIQVAHTLDEALALAAQCNGGSLDGVPH